MEWLRNGDPCMDRFELSHKNLNLVARDKTLDYGFYLHEYQLKKGALTEKKIVNFLRKHGYFCELRKMNRLFSRRAIQRLELKGQIFAVDCNLGRGTGNAKRNITSDVFQEGYFPYRFICLGRSGLVRLMQKALRPPKDSCTQTILRHFLKQRLTDAEFHAVFWKLGVRFYSTTQVKSTIQIDGVVKAKRMRVGV